MNEIKEGVRQHLPKENIFKLTGPDHLHTRVLKELAEKHSESLMLILKKSQKTGKIPKNRRTASTVQIFKRIKRNNPEL